jgi:hypothetical protein
LNEQQKEAVRDLIRRTIPAMVNQWLTDHGNNAEVVENKRDNVINFSRGVSKKKPPNGSDQ